MKIDAALCDAKLEDDGFRVRYSTADLEVFVRHTTINANLKPGQDAFQLAREIGARHMQRRYDLMNAGASRV